MVTDVGEVSKSSDPVEWTIPNFCDLPQEYDTIIRSPRFRYEDSDWYLEVYPNGRSLYSSFGWFGIGVLNVNSDSNVRDVRIWVSVSPNKNPMLLKASSNGNGFYCCTKLLPTSLLNSKRDFIGPSGNLRLLFDTDTDTMDDGELLMQLSKENGKRPKKIVFSF